MNVAPSPSDVHGFRNSEFNNDIVAESPSRTVDPLVPTSPLQRLTRTMSQVLAGRPPQIPPPTAAPPSSPHFSESEEEQQTVIESSRNDNMDEREYPIANADPSSSHSHPISRITQDKDDPDTHCSRRNTLRLPPSVMRFKPTLVLENTGNVARDHLASERTFLAYVRTSLVIASTGVGMSVKPYLSAPALMIPPIPLPALVQLFTIASVASPNQLTSFTTATKQVHGWARPIGSTMLCLALIVLCIGACILRRRSKLSAHLSSQA